MARVKLVSKPSDYPDTLDEAARKGLDELFGHLFPGQANAEIPADHSAFAAVARNPALALLLVKLTQYVVRAMPWSSQHSGLRELAIQTLNLHLKCDVSFQHHIRAARAEGLSLEQQSLIPFWRTATVFSEEQRLVIEYTSAVVAGEVPEELFSKVVRRYGERQAVEFTVAIGWFSLWAMIINATGTDFDYGYGKPAA